MITPLSFYFSQSPSPSCSAPATPSYQIRKSLPLYFSHSHKFPKHTHTTHTLRFTHTHPTTPPHSPTTPSSPCIHRLLTLTQYQDLIHQHPNIFIPALLNLLTTSPLRTTQHPEHTQTCTTSHLPRRTPSPVITVPKQPHTPQSLHPSLNPDNKSQKPIELSPQF